MNIMKQKTKNMKTALYFVISDVFYKQKIYKVKHLLIY